MRGGTARRMIYRGLGCCAVALGFIGLLVPGMPATVFVLAASYLFARSSPRLEAWLLAHRWLGRPLRRLSQTGGMTGSMKSAALASMWTSVLISSAALAAASVKAAAAAIFCAVCGSAAIVFAVRTVPDCGGTMTSSSRGQGWNARTGRCVHDWDRHG